MLSVLQGGVEVGSEDASSQSVVGGVGAVYNFIESFEFQDALHWPKDL